MKHIVYTLLAFGLMVGAAEAQVKNPTRVQFTVSVDHEQVTGYELDIVRANDNVVIQTLSIGKPTPDATGTAVATINVQPISFGSYYAVMRAVATEVKSENSAASNTFVRAPGSPSKVIF